MINQHENEINAITEVIKETADRDKIYLFGSYNADEHQAARERSYEYNLPPYLQHDLDAYKDGLKNGSKLLDCLWGELYGSINAAVINDGAITPEHADYLRQKYLRGGVRV